MRNSENNFCVENGSSLFLEEKKIYLYTIFQRTALWNQQSESKLHYRYCDSLHLERIKLIVIKWSYDNSELSAKGIELNVSP